MAGHSIKLSADTTAFKRDLMKLSREIDTTLSRRGSISLFDADTKKFLQEGAVRAIEDMAGAVKELESKNKGISVQLKDQKLTHKEILGLSKDYVRNLRQISSLKNEINALENNHANLLAKQSPGAEFGRSGAGRFLKGVGRSGMGKIPGMGMMRGAGGLGMAGMAGLGLGAGLLGAGAFAASRGFAGFNAFNQGVEDRITLMGRGFDEGQASGVFAPAQKLGMTAGQLRQAQIQSMDIFGASGATAEAVTGRAAAARGMGLNLGQFQEAGAGLRRQLGTEGAQKTFAKLQATMIATEIEGAVGPWLETTAAMLTQINESGVALDDGALMAMSNLTGPGGMSPERVQKTLMSIDDSMKSATGERAGFFMSAMSRQGIGAGTIGGAQVAMQMGLFGGSLEKAKKGGFIRQQDLADFEAQGILTGEGGGTDAFRSRMKGISDTFEDIAGGMSGTGRALVAQQLTGLQNPVEALKAMGIIGKLSTAQTPEEREKLQKELKDLQRSPQEKMVDRLDKIAKSTEGMLQVSQAFKEANLEVLGRQLAPLAIKANEALTNIDTAMTGILEFFGVETAQQAAERGKRERAVEMGGEAFGALPGKERGDLGRAVAAEINKLSARKEELKESIKRQESGRAGFASASDISELKAINETLTKLLAAQKENNDGVRKRIMQAGRPKNTELSGQPSATGAK